jgi:ribosomal protein L44E
MPGRDPRLPQGQRRRVRKSAGTRKQQQPGARKELRVRHRSGIRAQAKDCERIAIDHSSCAHDDKLRLAQGRVH